MNQYQRMVSYLYEYKQGIKGVNVGYVRIEQRGSACRISLQMRGRNLGQLPKMAIFRQETKGIRCLSMCSLMERNGDYRCRIETEADNLSGSGISLQEVDGIILYQDASYYVATTWKNTGIFIGEIQEWDQEADQKSETDGQERKDMERSQLSGQKGEGTQCNEQEMSQKSNLSGKKEESDDASEGDQSDMVQTMEQTLEEPETEQDSHPKQKTAEQIEAQTVCGNCPFKRAEVDYGKRILMTFPTMRPFPDDQGHACVRIEPQDLGCLPMQLWPLANNQFLLQGYYCYRHLIFVETGEQQYALGVPGIYSEQDRRQAEQFGFYQFRPLCSGRHCMGAFGYWLMSLSW